ncbi:MAG: sugar transferase [Candidatus Kuenenia sp.]|nr:sugar transferase [Candidatus Kuenenia hertensis]
MKFYYPASKRKIMLVLGDLFIVSLAIVLSAIVRLGIDGGLDYVKGNPMSFAVSGVVLITTFSFAELYDVRKDYKSIGIILSIIFATAIAFIITMVIFYINWSLRIGRGVFLINGALVIFFIAGWRMLYSYIIEQPLFNRRAFIIGAGWAGKTVLEEINKAKKAGIKVIGFVDDDPEKLNKRIHGIPVLGDRSAINTVIRKYNVDTIISAITHEKHADLIKTLIHCSWNGIDVIDMPSIYEQLTGKIPFMHINDMWMLHVVISKPKLYGRIIKPVLETIISLVLFTVSIPAIVLIAVVIKVTSRGSVFYTQERMGKDTRKFTIIKFRTMINDAESQTGAVYAADNDHRVTKVGKFLRKWRLDEIPQLLNVVKGDMSLVGPRPEREIFIKEFEKKIPFYSQRLAVKPGLSGWAQVKYPYASTIEQTEEKLQYDLYYIKNMSFLLDIVVLLKTVRVMLFGMGK